MILGFVREDLEDQIKSNKEVHDALLSYMDEYVYDIDSGIWKEAIHSLPSH